MSQTTIETFDTTSRGGTNVSRLDSASPITDQAVPLWQRIPLPAMGLTALFLLFVFIPPVRNNSRLVWSFVGVAAALSVWELLLASLARASGRLFRIEFVPVKSHYVQALVQSTIFLYWGLNWANVYPAVPLVLSQIIFLYALDALLSWSRGRTWRLGFGPLPIVISTNLLLWFRDDWFFLQFLMLTTGALGKQFITWNREGRRSHIFNPSAFGQSVFALGLIATGTTASLTWGKEIAQTFDPPHMLIVIFLGGLVVQYLFHVTLMTVAATATLCVINLIYTQATGTYFFVTLNIAAPIFLGLHLLVTDPATSPRTNLGRVVFGVLYGLGYAALFRILDLYDVPLFWDKLLPVPILNLLVPLIDRLTRAGVVGRINALWGSVLSPKALNLVHMGCWVALFVTMEATGFVEAPHPGDSIAFWKKALAEGKPHAGRSLVIAAGAHAEGGGSAAAYNELGLICIDGKVPEVIPNNARAAHYFSQACEMGDVHGCENVAIQYLFLRQRRSDADAARALDTLEKQCETASDEWLPCYLVGSAYETGRGRPVNLNRAIQLYKKCGVQNVYAAKGLARIKLAWGDLPLDLGPIVATLTWSADRGDAESCWYLAYMHHLAQAVNYDEGKSRGLLEKACKLGAQTACAALAAPSIPPYSKPLMLVPGWSSAFPLQ